MNKLLLKITIFSEFIIAIICGYVTLTYTFTTLLPNLILAFITLFFIVQALGNVDKINGYNQNNTRLPDNNQNNTGLPDNNQNNEMINQFIDNEEKITFIIDDDNSDNETI